MKIEPTFRSAIETKKGWGKEVEIANNEKYCGKLLVFKEGAKFSNHFHLIKSETFMILKGRIEFKCFDLTNANEFTYIFDEGQIIDIPAGCPHQIKAIIETTIVEVSTHHEDTDSYRIGKGDSQK